MSVCACWCPLVVSFFRPRGAARSLNTPSSPSAPSPKERFRQLPPSHDGLTTNPSAVRFELGSRALALFLLDNNSTDNRPDVSIPIAWPSVWTAFGSAFVNLITSDQMCTHGSRDTAGLRAQQLGIIAPIDSQLGSRDTSGVCLRNSCPRRIPFDQSSTGGSNHLPSHPSWVVQLATQILDEQLGRASSPNTSKLRGREQKQGDESRNPKNKETNPDEKDCEPGTPT